MAAGKSQRRGKVRIGTSGWSYDHWHSVFYPEQVSASGRLGYYARHFSTAEINNSFYQMPGVDTLARWREAVPGDFVFSVKASRYITHMKKLKEPEVGVPRFLDRMSVLDDHLGPVLFQLPSRWRANPERLETFLGALDDDFRYAFEFRDPSWYEPAILNLLRNKGAAFCIYDLRGHQSPEPVTADFVYMRLHGPGDAYQGRYTRNDLAARAQRIRDWADRGLDVYVYFDNDAAGYAAANAAELSGLVAGAT